MSSTADEHRKHDQKGQGTVVQKLSTVSPGGKQKNRENQKNEKLNTRKCGMSDLLLNGGRLFLFFESC